MIPPPDAPASTRLRPDSVLCCFAVKPEARFLSHPEVRRCFTGIGSRRARAACQAELERTRPAWVLSCGFAGGLDPRHATGTVLFDADQASGLTDLLLTAGARQGRFWTPERVVMTAREKQALWTSSGADAVEMESESIRLLCRSWGIPSATIRAISDAARDDLPLDFNELLTASQHISYARILVRIVGAPWTIPALLRLGRQAELAARHLGEVLNRVLGR